MDLYTQILPIIGAIGVLASLYFGFKGLSKKRAELFLSVSDVFHLNKKSYAAPGKVVYKFEGKEIEGDTFLVSFLVINVGQLDITEKRFINPISIKFPDGVEIVTFDASIDKGNEIGIDLEIEGDQIAFDWDILKPLEELTIDVVCFAKDSKITKTALAKSKILARLENVTIRKHRTNFLRMTTWSIFLGLLLGTVCYLFTVYANFPKEERLTFTKQNKTYTIVEHPFNGNILCEITDDFVLMSNCKELESSVISDVDDEIIFKEGFIGISIWDLLISCLIGILLVFSGMTVFTDPKLRYSRLNG